MKVRVKKASAPTLKRAERKPEGNAGHTAINVTQVKRTFKQFEKCWEMYKTKYFKG